MTLINFNMEFLEKPETKKGIYGESLVDSWLIENSFSPYYPMIKNKPHAVDRVIFSEDKKNIFIAEVKTKPLLTKFPATGIDTKNLKEYIHIQEKYKIKVYVFFVDSFLGSVYGNDIVSLTENKNESKQYLFCGKDYILKKQKEICDGSITVWPISEMTHFFNLEKTQIEILNSFETNNRYSPDYNLSLGFNYLGE